MELKNKSTERLLEIEKNLNKELDLLYQARAMLPSDSYLGYLGCCAAIKKKEKYLSKVQQELKSRGTAE